MNRWTDEQMNRWTAEQRNRWTDEQMNRRTEEQMNRCTDEQVDIWTFGHLDRWTDGQMNINMYIWIDKKPKTRQNLLCAGSIGRPVPSSHTSCRCRPSCNRTPRRTRPARWSGVLYNNMVYQGGGGWNMVYSK